MTLVLTILFGITTLVGVGISVFYGRRAEFYFQRTLELESRLHSFDWQDVLVGVTDLAAEVKSVGVDLIFAVSLRGAILSYFLADVLPTNPPVVVGVQQWNDEAPLLDQLAGYEIVATGRSQVQIPDALRAYSDRTLLIVDDLAFSGDAMAAIKEEIIGWGFERARTKTLTLVATNVAIKNDKAPDLYWQAVDKIGFFPWGRGR